MLCEKCGQELQTVRCSGCGNAVLKLGPCCYLCGKALELASPEPAGEAEDSDFGSRVLCSDGTCIGVINEQGVCKVCGKSYSPDV